MNALRPLDDTNYLPTTELLLLQEAMVESAKASLAANTWKGYASDFRGFEAFCATHFFSSLPARPETVGLYAQGMARDGKAWATIARHISSITKRHDLANLPDPTLGAELEAVLEGIKRTIGTRQEGKKALTVEVATEVVAKLDLDEIADIRDKAIVLLQAAGAFRRSEASDLQLEDLTFVEHGVEILIRHSKTDQVGAGEMVAVPYALNQFVCPVAALKSWIETAGLDGMTGPVFRRLWKGGRVSDGGLNPESINRMIQTRVSATGRDGKEFGGHSGRAGFVTEACRRQINHQVIMSHGRWKSANTVARYNRQATLWANKSATQIF